jgi:hypothetical protein
MIKKCQNKKFKKGLAIVAGEKNGGPNDDEDTQGELIHEVNYAQLYTHDFL